MSEQPHIFLFTNTGTLKPPTSEEARVIHNATAGNPQGVAAAKALGDLSHLVYVPMGAWSGQIMFMDQWTSAEGLQQFFSDHDVQEGGAQIFSQFEPVVWRPDNGFLAYHIASPLPQTERYVAYVRGTVTSFDKAYSAMNEIWRACVNRARKAGLQSHEIFVRLAAPGSPESMEVFGVDVWSNNEGFNEIYGDGEFLQAFDGVFTAEAATGVLQRPAGDWIEW